MTEENPRDEVFEKFVENNKFTWDLVCRYIEQIKKELGVEHD